MGDKCEHGWPFVVFDEDDGQKESCPWCRIEELKAELSKVRSEYQEHVAMVARKERPAYDEQQQIIMRLREANKRQREALEVITEAYPAAVEYFNEARIKKLRRTLSALEGGEDV